MGREELAEGMGSGERGEGGGDARGRTRRIRGGKRFLKKFPDSNE